MNENIFIALKIMGQGMAGIFAATFFIAGAVSFLSRIFSR